MASPSYPNLIPDGPIPRPRQEGGYRTLAVNHLPPGTGEPLFSIITVVLNGKPTLQRAMESVLRQDYAPLEYVVIDGGSTDGSLEIIRAFEDRIAYWVSAPDGGLSAAMNKGVGFCRGRFIGLIHSDDWLEDGALSAVANAFALSGADVICGAMRQWRHNDPAYVFHPNPANLVKEMTVNHPATFLKAELYREVAFQPQYKYAMDYDLLLRLYHSGKRFHVYPGVLVNASQDGLSWRNWTKAIWETAEIKNRVLGKSALHGAYALFSIFRRYVADLLSGIGFGFVVRWYKAQHSLVHKDQPPPTTP